MTAFQGLFIHLKLLCTHKKCRTNSPQNVLTGTEGSVKNILYWCDQLQTK